MERNELEEVREVDPDGRIVVHHRIVDTLGKLLRSGTISQEMRDAAKDFQAAFILANLDPILRSPIHRVQGSGREPDFTERQLDARRRVHTAMQALGGIRARREPAYGMSLACTAVCARGRCDRAGMAGRCGRNRHRGFRSRRWGCWPCTSATRRRLS